MHDKMTPGPWEVNSGMVQTVSGTPIAWMDRNTGNGTMPVERDRNAQAIAALPDLISALCDLTATARTFRNVPQEEQEWTPTDDAALEQAFEALRKAGV